MGSSAGFILSSMLSRFMDVSSESSRSKLKKGMYRSDILDRSSLRRKVEAERIPSRASRFASESPMTLKYTRALRMSLEVFTWVIVMTPDTRGSFSSRAISWLSSWRINTFIRSVLLDICPRTWVVLCPYELLS